MIRFRGKLFQGSSSRYRPVRLEVNDDELQISVEGDTADTPRSYPLTGIGVSSRLGNTPRWLSLGNDLKIETRDNDAVDQLLRESDQGRSLWLHRLESRWSWLLVFLVIVLGSSWGFAVRGLPEMAKQVAFVLPEEVSRELGQQTLESLDQLAFKPSRLSPQRQQQLQQQFQQMLAHIDDNTDSSNNDNNDDTNSAGGKPRSGQYQLLFRDSPVLGANAFALPSGTLVMTDALVRLADSDQQLISVLAHEIGHVEHRHSLRRAIQSSVLPLIIMSVTGDVSSATALVATLPTLALEASYSQEFEREADAFAQRYLQQQGISPGHFITLLQKLENAHPDNTPAFFSTHPATRERIEALRKH